MNREVLLIEDDANYRLSIKYLFRDEPYQFVEAESPEEGIETIDANPQIRVILLDLSFPHGQGTAVLDYLNDRFADRSADYRVIVLTSQEEILRAERAGEYSVFNYLPKTDRSSKQAIQFSIEQAFKDLERELLYRKSRFIFEIQERITARARTNETLDFICRATRLTVGAYTCHIRVYDFTRGDYHLSGFAGAEDTMRQAFERPKVKGDLFSGKVVETGQPETFEDLQSMKEFRLFAAKALEDRENVSSEEEHYWRNVRSAYIVPISSGLFENAVDAVLNVSSESMSFFDEDKCSLVREFVTQATLALTRDWHQRQLASAERNSVLSLLVSAVAHEINNTSGLIPANVAGIRAQLGTPNDNINRRLALIERVANQATEFAKELASFAAARRGEKQKLNLNEVVRSAIDDLQGIPKYKNSDAFRIELAFCDKSLMCEVFENPFLQIVRNIIINAFQALEGAGTQEGAVIVSTSKSENEIVTAAILEFKDNGPGISPEYKAKIFEPDFTTKPNGNGLGLWLVRTQLEQVGGMIDEEGEPGEGARFVIRIPLAPDTDTGEHPR